MPELVAQAHDRLHKDDVPGAHGFLHRALGLDEPAEGEAWEPLLQHADWDADFRKLCLRHGVRAMFVLVDTVDDGDRTRLVSGGDRDLCQHIDHELRNSRR